MNTLELFEILITEYKELASIFIFNFISISVIFKDIENVAKNLLKIIMLYGAVITLLGNLV